MIIAFACNAKRFAVAILVFFSFSFSSFFMDGMAKAQKPKSLYLFYQSAYGHQTWQDGNLP